MLVTSVVFFVIFKKLTAPNLDASESGGDTRTESERRDEEVKNRKKYLSFIVGVGKARPCEG